MQREEDKMLRGKSINKKIICFFLILGISLAVLSAKEKKASNSDSYAKTMWDRYFEFGIRTEVSLGNNSYLGLKELLQKEININTAQLAKSAEKGFQFDFGTHANIFANLNLKKVKIGFFTNINAEGMFFFDKSVLQFLSSGNPSNKPLDLSAGIGSSVYLSTGVSVNLRFGKLFIGVAPSYYVPLLLIPYSTVSAKAMVDSKGNISVTGGTRISAYSVLSLDSIAKTKALPSSFNVTDILKQGGVDLDLSVMYGFFPSLDIGGTLKHIPIVPSKLRDPVVFTADANLAMEAVLSKVLSKKELKPTVNFNQGFVSADSKTIIRPFRINVFAHWRVFKTRIFVVSPEITLRLGGDAFRTPLGMGYKIHAQGNFGPFSPFVSTSYKDSMFIQKVGFLLNLRALELDLAISSRSQDFLKSFLGKGLGLNLGIILGF